MVYHQRHKQAHNAPHVQIFARECTMWGMGRHSMEAIVVVSAGEASCLVYRIMFAVSGIMFVVTVICRRISSLGEKQCGFLLAAVWAGACYT